MPNNRSQISLSSYALCVSQQVEFLTGTEHAIPTEWVREHYDHNVSVDAAAADIVATRTLTTAQ